MDHTQQHGDPILIDLQWFGDGEGNPEQASGKGEGDAGSLLTELATDPAGSGADPALQEGAQSGKTGDAGKQGGKPTELPGWTAAATKELKADPRFMAYAAKFKSFDEAVKSALDLDSKVGGMISIPTDKSTPEEIAAYYAKVGVPSKPEEYKLDRNPELLVNESEEAEFKKFLFDNHVPQSLAGSLHKMLGERAAKVLVDFATRQAEAKTALQADLQKEWGNEFGDNIKIAQRGILAYTTPSLREKIYKAGIGNDKELFLLFHRLGQLTREDTAGKRGDASHPTNPTKGFEYPGL